MTLPQESYVLYTSKITAKGQTTIPQEVRNALGLGAGDKISFEVDEQGNVTLRRFQPTDLEYLKALETSFTEWKSQADEEAYRDL